MFKSARIKLTIWYFLIVMIVSASFSTVIYQVLTSELDRVERMQRTRIENNQPAGIPPIIDNETRRFFYLDPDLITETKNRIKLTLLLINLGILGASTAGGYFLSGKTLKPIKEMVDEQNRFISDASHELRTPLTSLKTEIEVALRGKRISSSEARNLLLSNLEEVDNLQTLSDNLIKLAQYQKGKNGLVITKFSIREIVLEAVKKVVKLAKGKNIQIIDKTKNHYLFGEKVSLTEMLTIFLDNAVKYSPEKSKVTIATEKSDSRLQIMITDKGFGIAKKDIPHIFDRFYRADQSRNKNKTAGYGLGLSIAKEIVQRHKGTVKVESKVGQGTKFIVSLPLIENKKA
jgi:signal transduction histidine kinase